MAPRSFVFLIVFAAIVGGSSFYVHRKASWTAGLGPRARRVLGAVLGGAVLLTVASRVAERRLPAGLLEPLGVLGSMIALGALIAAVPLAAADLVGLVVRAVLGAVRWARLRGPERAGRETARAQGRKGPEALPALSLAPLAPLRSPEPPAPSPVSRRVFLGRAATGSVLAVGAGSSFYGTFFGRHDYVIEEVPVALPGLSPKLDGYTLVQLSDIHLGLFVGEPEMRSAEDLVRRVRPDLLVLTGDFVDHDPRYHDALGRLIARLAPLARDGVMAVPGNHDYYAGIDVVVSALERAGAVVLRNEGRVLGQKGAAFALLGVDDVMGPRNDPRSTGPDVHRALAAVPGSRDMPRVLLCHNPEVFPAAAGHVDLQLSGHTHGGQVKVGLSLVDLALPFVAGRYTRGGSQLYVNRGFGTAGPPARVGAPPEVSRIVLTV
jgi:predicted MPP superfamily phosphohydrolase